MLRCPTFLCPSTEKWHVWLRSAVLSCCCGDRRLETESAQLDHVAFGCLRLGLLVRSISAGLDWAGASLEPPSGFAPPSAGLCDRRGWAQAT